MNVNIADKADEQSELLVKTMLQGLKMIQGKYPDTIKLINIKG